MAKLQFDGRQYKLTLPKKLLEALGWKKGDIIEIELDSAGKIALKNASIASIAMSEYVERIEYVG